VNRRTATALQIRIVLSDEHGCAERCRLDHNCGLLVLLVGRGVLEVHLGVAVPPAPEPADGGLGGVHCSMVTGAGWRCKDALGGESKVGAVTAAGAALAGAVRSHGAADELVRPRKLLAQLSLVVLVCAAAVVGCGDQLRALRFKAAPVWAASRACAKMQVAGFLPRQK
jgi:hypothetical protein